jgi:hypothetical protein
MSLSVLNVVRFFLLERWPEQRREQEQEQEQAAEEEAAREDRGHQEPQR